MKPRHTRTDELHFISTKTILKEAVPPVAPVPYWKSANGALAIAEGCINIISTDSTSKAVQLSLRIATEVARTIEPITPSRGLNPYTKMNESEAYDKMRAAEAKPMPVLYINTLLSAPQLEKETIAALPELPEWLWVDRNRGKHFPYDSLAMHQVSASMGTLMKDGHKAALMQFIHDNRIKLVVVNSFEFACRTQREKDDMMCLLKEIRDQYGCSVLVFTRESETRLRTATRGAMPMLAMIAECVLNIKAVAPEIKSRRLEYSEPVQLALPAAPVYVKSEELIESLRNVSDEVMLDVAPLLPVDVGVPRPNFDIHRNGNPPMNIA